MAAIMAPCLEAHGLTHTTSYAHPHTPHTPHPTQIPQKVNNVQMKHRLRAVNIWPSNNRCSVDRSAKVI